ncbi:MAG: hypothetical protein EB023_11520 [Flavobacteriia bacterium]|nr:hypothetical protein [Flavobacteriia bacterium]
MIRSIIVGLFLGSYALCAAQCTYFLTGRPFGFERNNAIKEVGFRWGITVCYAGNDVAEELGLSAIAAANDSVQVRMEKSHGAAWLTAFYQEVDREEQWQNKVRMALVKKEGNGGNNRYVLVRNLGKRKCEAFMLDVSTSKTQCLGWYRGKVKRNVKLIKQASECTLPYDFPENGVLK